MSVARDWGSGGHQEVPRPGGGKPGHEEDGLQRNQIAQGDANFSVQEPSFSLVAVPRTSLGGLQSTVTALPCT